MLKKSIKDMQTYPFKQFDETWALLTAGDINNHNSMTISWGEMGTLWGKNVVTVFVKPCRNTYSFMNNNDYFVLSFFDEEYRKALLVMGSHSGRDVNKDELSKLTPMEYKDVTIYKEAKVTLICKKIYFNDIDINNVPKEAKERYYEVEKPHRMFIGEVIETINK